MSDHRFPRSSIASWMRPESDACSVNITRIHWLPGLFGLEQADRMLDMGFEPQIRSIIEGKGKHGKHSAVVDSSV